MRRNTPIALLLLPLLSCGETAPPVDRIDPAALFSSAVSRIVFEVDYMTGAEPYAVEVREGAGIWSIFRANLEALFPAGDKTFVLPTSLADMTEVSGITGETFTVDGIMAASHAHRDLHIEGDQVAIHLLFLNGRFHDGEQVRDDILGLNMGETGVIALFKPVIASTALAGNANLAVFVEQATMAHEVGHAVGLVGRALETTSDHHDTAHGNHCVHGQCLMHYNNEGAIEMARFTQRLQRGGSPVLFGSACLDDARAAAGLEPMMTPPPPGPPPRPRP